MSVSTLRENNGDLLRLKKEAKKLESNEYFLNLKDYVFMYLKFGANRFSTFKFHKFYTNITNVYSFIHKIK
jgi:hypothetical protein